MQKSKQNYLKLKNKKEKSKEVRKVESSHGKAAEESETEQKPKSIHTKVEELPEKRFKTYLRLRPCQEVNKSFFKTIENKNGHYQQKLTINKSVFNRKDSNSPGELTFDSIFDEDYTQLEIFQEMCVPLIQNLTFNKKSSIILVQGINDSGKTFSIIGDSENPGLLPLSLRFIHDKVKDLPQDSVQIFCNFLEIYDENAYDLLSEEKIKVILPIAQNSLKNITYFPLNKIQDFSKAINTANKNKKMEGLHSTSNTIFKIILRFLNEARDKYEERSFTIIDTAFPCEREFINFDGEIEGNLTFHEKLKMKHDLYSLQYSLFETLFNVRRKITKARSHKIPMYFTPLTVLLRYYFYSNETFVLLTTLKPLLTLNEENLKVLNFGLKLKSTLQVIDEKQEDLKNKFENRGDISEAGANGESTSHKKKVKDTPPKEEKAKDTHLDKTADNIKVKNVKKLLVSNGLNKNLTTPKTADSSPVSINSPEEQNKKESEKDPIPVPINPPEEQNKKKSEKDPSTKHMREQLEALKIMFEKQGEILEKLGKEKEEKRSHSLNERKKYLTHQLDSADLYQLAKDFANVIILNPTIQHFTVSNGRDLVAKERNSEDHLKLKKNETISKISQDDFEVKREGLVNNAHQDSSSKSLPLNSEAEKKGEKNSTILPKKNLVIDTAEGSNEAEEDQSNFSEEPFKAGKRKYFQEDYSKNTKKVKGRGK